MTLAMPPTRRLTKRQRQVLRAFIEHGQKGAARELGISPHTVRATLSTIRSKLGVESSALAALVEFGRRA